MRAAAIAVAAALFITPAVSAAKRAPTHDWSHTVVVTPDGGFRIGNPSAKVKLVEYGSLACPHCKHFEETGYNPLVQRYVGTGQVSYEFRNLLINGPDVSVSLLTRCSGPSKFFAMSEFVYATQPQWQKKFEDMSDADKAALDKMTDQERIIRFAQIGGLTQVAARFGVTPTRARQCLSDAKELKRVVDMTKAAEDGGIDHTPTFLIDGKVTGASTWEQLEPLLKTALADRT